VISTDSEWFITEAYDLYQDVDLLDRSFGFTTSVEAAQAAIVSAKTEARCNLPNGIGIVKLMGRSAGRPVFTYLLACSCLGIAIFIVFC
jgi:6-phosphofructokinase